MVTDKGIFEAYYDCLRGKRRTAGAMEFFTDYQGELLDLADSINARTYRPSTSTAFVVSVPVRREVFAAAFRDRIVHHYLMLRLEPLFEKVFSNRTFNCRKGKGTLYGVRLLCDDIRKCSEEYTRDCWVMKLDIRGFFMSIDKDLLDGMLKRFIAERYHGGDKDDVLWLTHLTVMHCPQDDCVRKSPMAMWNDLPAEKSLFTNGGRRGLPIGNLSSQHFANFYLSPLDDYVEHTLCYRYYGRYVDDFYIVGTDRRKLLEDVGRIRDFLSERLHLTMHPTKFYFQHYTKGVRFVGYVVRYDRILPGRRLLRHLHRKVDRLNAAHGYREVSESTERLNSYLGMMRHTLSYLVRKNALLRMSHKAWGRVYIKGSWRSVRVKRIWRRQPAGKEEWPTVINYGRI